MAFAGADDCPAALRVVVGCEAVDAHDGAVCWGHVGDHGFLSALRLRVEDYALGVDVFQAVSVDAMEAQVVLGGVVFRLVNV